MIALLVVAGGSAATAGETSVPDRARDDRSDNVRVVARLPHEGGTSLAFDGRVVYAGQWDGKFDRREKPNQGGAFIVDISGPRPRKVGYAACAGNDAKVGTVSPGLLAIGYNTSAQCHPGSNIVLFDTSNPTRPRLLGGVNVTGGSHTLTPYPGKPLLYSSPGGTGTATQSIVDVSDPRRPEVVGTFAARPLGCHDFSFHVTRERQLGFCTGGGQTSIWDVSDPVAPSLVNVIANPLVQFPHYALASPSGDILVIQDEAFAGHECVTGHSPTGALWFYDISDVRTPVLLGRFAVGRGSQPVGVFTDAGPVNGWLDSWCTAHNFNFVNEHTLSVAWFSGGVNIVDISDPSFPEEVAFYRPDGAVANTAYWYRGRVYVNDHARGLEVLTIAGLRR